MIRKILVPANHNNLSTNALETAIRIARNNKAILQILHITYDNEADFNKSEDKTKFRYIYDAMAGRIFQKHGISTEIIFAEGSPGPVILRIGFEKRPALIIMESFGELEEQQCSIGKIANYVVKNAECPVLIVPPGRKSSGFETILFPVRSDRGTLKQFDFVRDMTCGNGKKCQFEIFALLMDAPGKGFDYVSGIVDELEHEMNGEENVKVSLSYNPAMHIADEVLDKADAINADLLVIPSEIDVPDNDFYIGPYSQQIMNRTRIPFLRVRNF